MHLGIQYVFQDNHACSNEQKHKFYKLTKKTREKLQISAFHNLRQSQLFHIQMDNQSSCKGNAEQKLQSLQPSLRNSEFMSTVFCHQKNKEKQKNIAISAVIECSEQAKFFVSLAKIAIVFNINIDSMLCLQKFSKKQIANIKNYNFESLLADTNRKQFVNFFQKFTIPQLSLSATLRNLLGIVLIIQHPENQIENYKIKVLNYENLTHSILSNIKFPQGIKQLNKFLDSKYKRITTLICFDRAKDKITNKQLSAFLIQKYPQVFYITVASDEEIQPCSQQMEIITLFNKNIIRIEAENFSLIGTNSLSNECIQSLCNFYNKYSKINNLLKNQISKSKISRTEFNQNQLCIQFYGVFYNFISIKDLENISDEELLQKLFLEQFIAEKQQREKNKKKIQKKTQNRKLGHYPAKIAKGSKVCCVCEDDKKKKSRYKCQKCSDTYSRDIAICIEHFKEYHDNMYKYIPKGVRKGAYKNQILHFNKEGDRTDKGDSKISSEAKSKENLEKIIQKWDQKRSIYQNSFNYTAMSYVESHPIEFSYYQNMHHMQQFNQFNQHQHQHVQHVNNIFIGQGHGQEMYPQFIPPMFYEPFAPVKLQTLVQPKIEEDR